MCKLRFILTILLLTVLVAASDYGEAATPVTISQEQKGESKKPAYDLNSDGIQDYLDDYILVAHWLLKQQPGVNKGGNKPVAVGK